MNKADRRVIIEIDQEHQQPPAGGYVDVRSPFSTLPRPNKVSRMDGYASSILQEDLKSQGQNIQYKEQKISSQQSEK